MAEAVHPGLTDHLPFFIVAPGQTDGLMVVTAFILLFAVFGFGVFFFRLHSLPEHIAHKSHRMQAELVAVLCLISLFTHMHIFWIVALIVAMIELPDFGTPLNRIAGSAEKLAGLQPGEGAIDAPAPAGHAKKPADAPSEAAVRQPDDPIPMHPPPEAGPVKPRGRAHA